MSTTTARTGSPPDAMRTDLRRTARTTGLLYLAFFFTGIAGSIVVRGRLFAADDPHGTLSNLTEHGSQQPRHELLRFGTAPTGPSARSPRQLPGQAGHARS